MAFFRNKNILSLDGTTVNTYSVFYSQERDSYNKESNNLQKLKRQYSSSKFIIRIILSCKINHNRKQLYTKAKEWLSIMDNFFEKHSCKSTPADIDISRCLLSNKVSYPNKVRLQYYSFIFHEYISGYLLKKVTQKNIERYISKIDYLSIDFEAIAYCIEKENNKKLPQVYLTCGHRSCLRKKDLMFAARSLFYIESIERIEDIWDSDLIPAAISYIRLYVDLCFQSLIPYKSIEDSKTNKECHITGLRKQFIEEQIKIKSSNVSSLDGLEMLVTIYEWSCDAVHYGYLYIDCVTDWVMERIFSVLDKFLFVDNNTMKTDFESFVASHYPKLNYKVIW